MVHTVGANDDFPSVTASFLSSRNVTAGTDAKIKAVSTGMASDRCFIHHEITISWENRNPLWSLGGDMGKQGGVGVTPPRLGYT